MKEIFFVPDPLKNVNITRNDIDSKQIRLTINNKKYFPNEDEDILIKYKDITYVCKFRTNDSDGKTRSYKILLKEDLFSILNIKTTSIIEFIQLDKKKYEI